VRELSFAAALAGSEFRIAGVAELADAQNASCLLTSELQSFVYAREYAGYKRTEKTLIRCGKTIVRDAASIPKEVEAGYVAYYRYPGRPFAEHRWSSKRDDVVGDAHEGQAGGYVDLGAGQSGRIGVEVKIKRTRNVEEGRAVSFST
jgi:hypothetical protein